MNPNCLTTTRAVRGLLVGAIAASVFACGGGVVSPGVPSVKELSCERGEGPVAIRVCNNWGGNPSGNMLWTCGKRLQCAPTEHVVYYRVGAQDRSSGCNRKVIQACEVSCAAGEEPVDGVCTRQATPDDGRAAQDAWRQQNPRQACMQDCASSGRQCSQSCGQRNYPECMPNCQAQLDRCTAGC